MDIPGQYKKKSRTEKTRENDRKIIITEKKYLDGNIVKRVKVTCTRIADVNGELEVSAKQRIRNK